MINPVKWLEKYIRDKMVSYLPIEYNLGAIDWQTSFKMFICEFIT